jgi:serine kinase of HPr protein (carbohydrate metabolism regulator)
MLNRSSRVPAAQRLIATCHGLVSDEADDGHQPTSTEFVCEIGRFNNLDEAIGESARYVAERRHEVQQPPETCVAMALHVDIRDEQDALALRGMVLGELLDWCPPARNRREARALSVQLERLAQEFAHQDMVVERETTPRLGSDHVDRILERMAYLEGCLVAPPWRDRAIGSLKKQMRQWDGALAAEGHRLQAR